VRLADLAAWVPKRRHSVALDTWNSQYASGYWEHLQSVAELAHYSLIVGYCKHFKPRGAILDVGCGAGVLQKLLSPHYSRYLGIDLSEEAIRRARTCQEAMTSFLQADAALFAPEARYDVIVFNECLSYFERPLQIMRRYEAYLEPHGLFVVSNVVRRRTAMARKTLESHYRRLDRVMAENSAGIRWELEVLSPPRA